VLDRALENLIGNALRHATSQASLCIARQQDDYLLEVADDGPGIDPALAPQIFEPSCAWIRAGQTHGGAGWGWPSCAASPTTTAARCNCCQAAAVPVSA
jgi:two-component system sensor histidine kinase RstB